MSDHLNRLMNEIGPALSLDAVLAGADGTSWELILAEGFSLILEHEGSDDRLTISGTIAPLGPEPAPELLVRMLQYNALSTETGGVRLALDSDLNAQLVYDTPTAALMLHTLKTIVLSLADKIVAWQSVMQPAEGHTTTKAPLTSDDTFVMRI